LYWGFAYKYNGIAAQFMTIRKKQILARAIRTQKENWGKLHFWKENAIFIFLRFFS